MEETNLLEIQVEVPNNVTDEQLYKQLDNLTLKWSCFQEDSDSSFDFGIQNSELNTDKYTATPLKEFKNKYFF